LKTIYFPLSEWIFYCCYQLSGEMLWSYKILYLIAEMATMFGLYLILTRLNIPKKYLLLYALCPLSIIEFAVDGHLDAVGLPFFIFGLFFYLNDRKYLAYVLLGLSISIKPVGLIFLPLFLFFEKGWRNKITAVVVPPLTVAVQFIPYIFTSNPFETLFDFTKNWSFNGIVFETLNLYFNDNQPSRLWCGVLLVIVLALLLFKRRNFTDTLYFALLSLMIFSPVVHPWYVGWIAVILPIARRWSGIALAAGVSLTSFTVMHYRLTGVWQQYPAVLALEYIPVIVLAIVELRGHLAWKGDTSVV
ncbi:MAG TPA: glycosyltransferase 87 family protein, partial [Bacteroidota bacterium]|nr:glycosyltransferase 87 family protein [Bacteroidota bacterium]